MWRAELLRGRSTWAASQELGPSSKIVTARNDIERQSQSESEGQARTVEPAAGRSGPITAWAYSS